MINITQIEDYREIIRIKTKELGHTYKILAENCRIHSSYFSRVMVGKADFSSEQIYLIGKMLDLNDWEMDYFGLLGEVESSGNNNHKSYLNKKIKKIREERQRVLKNLNAEIVELTEKDVQVYYSEVITAKIHTYLCLKKYYRNTPNLLCPILNISQKKLVNELKKLEKLNIISTDDDGKITILKTNVFLDDTNPIFPQFLMNWRLDSVNHISKRERNPEDYHFSIIFTTSKKKKEELRKLFKEFIIESQKKFSSLTKEEKKNLEVCHMNFDLY